MLFAVVVSVIVAAAVPLNNEEVLRASNSELSRPFKILLLEYENIFQFVER